jgi:hypothetical protein
MLADPFDLSELQQTLPQPKPVPTSPIVEKKQENTIPTTIAIPNPVPPPPIIEKKQENNPTTASTVPKPAVEVTEQKGKSVLSSPYMKGLLQTTQLLRNETILFILRYVVL